MAGLPITYPLIGGLRYDFTAISFFANGTPIVGITKLDYDQELAPTDVYATMPQKIGATRGQLKPTATMTMLQLEYELFIVALCALNGTPGSGYMEVRWDMQVLYQDGAG